MLLLSAFVFWLISFPMAGFLLSDPILLPYFLIGHITGLFTIYLLPHLFKIAYPYFLALTSLLTFLLPFTGFAEIKITFIGFFSAFFAVIAGVSLKSAGTQLTFLGLALGNLSALVLKFMPVSDNTKFLVLSVVVLLPSINYRTSLNYPPLLRDKFLLYILSLLFLMYLIGGLMYGGFVRLLEESSDLPWIKLAFYVISVLASYFILIRKLPEELILLLSIISFVFSFTIMHLDIKPAMYMGIYLLELGFGFLDFYLLLVLYKKENPIQAFALGFSIVCLAILMGYFVAFFGSVKDLLLAVGNLILLSVLIYIVVLNFQRLSIKTSVHDSSKVEDLASSEEDKELQKKELCREFLSELNQNIPEHKKS
ncbi:hypothetical protein [Thermocrinis sp.]